MSAKKKTQTPVEEQEIIGIGENKVAIREKIKNTILTAKEHFIDFSSGRGVGKTYTTQLTVVVDCMDNGKEFMLTVPIKDMKDTGALRKWLHKCLYENFNDYEFNCTRDELFYRKSEFDDWKRLAVCVPLSKAESDKINSYPLVKYIILDEAVCSDVTQMNTYINHFLTIYHTVDRDEDRVKAIFLGNKLQKVNPINKFFDLTVADLKVDGLVKRSFNKIAWLVPMPPDVKEKETGATNMFRQMIEATEYGEMAEGIFDTNYGFLMEEPDVDWKTYSVYGLQLGDSCWVNLFYGQEGKMYAQSVPESWWKSTPSIKYVTSYKQANEYAVIPIFFIEKIRLLLEHGLFKFIDEESLLVLINKFQVYLKIRIEL